MLKTLDLLIGLTVVMLLVSMIVTVLTQAITNVLQMRGKHLLVGITDLLVQLHPNFSRETAGEIAAKVLSHPMIRSGGERFGTVIHREELTKLLLELAAGNGAQRLEPGLRDLLNQALKDNGIQDATQTIENVRTLALQLEESNPELATNARYSLALLQEAKSPFLAKINGWFDQTIDRVADRFTNSTRIITIAGSLVVAMILQLDTASLVNRLSSDPALRQALVEQAVQIDQQKLPATFNNVPARNAPGPPGNSRAPAGKASNTQTPPSNSNQTGNVQSGTPAGQLFPSLTPKDRENLQELMRYDLVEFPESLSDWRSRWTSDNWLMKLLGIVLTAMLLSLGAPFWYNALKNLLRLRSLIAAKDDDQRAQRQSTQAPADTPAGPVTAAGGTLVGERGDLASVG